MKITLQKTSRFPAQSVVMHLIADDNQAKNLSLSDDELKYFRKKRKDKAQVVALQRYSLLLLIGVFGEEKVEELRREALRKLGTRATHLANAEKAQNLVLVPQEGLSSADVLDVCEGAALANYQFLKRRKDADEKRNSLQQIAIQARNVAENDLNELISKVEAVYAARDMVNEPYNYMTATDLANEFKRLGKTGGFRVEVLNKARIEALKMGGLLAVNKGSLAPPTFTIAEYKPKNAVNKKPLIFVGKGVVYDTGGLSLKPTKGSMDTMKCDMAGAAAVAGALYAIAKAGLPVHVVGLVPATDNRPGGEAYAPGDVITMHNGLQVEVLNTDAEGRMILADALSYARKYDPELVIDLATLTGAAVVSVGVYASVVMGTAPDAVMRELETSGSKTYERLVRMPFWSEYGEEIKSSVADIKNIGGPYAGSITAGKFLEHFTEYPWIHIDIAGPSFLDKASDYRPAGGTGTGVRTLFDFVKSYAQRKRS